MSRCGDRWLFQWNLFLHSGAVSSALRQKCGRELEAACKKEGKGFLFYLNICLQEVFNGVSGIKFLKELHRMSWICSPLVSSLFFFLFGCRCWNLLQKGLCLKHHALTKKKCHLFKSIPAYRSQLLTQNLSSFLSSLHPFCTFSFHVIKRPAYYMVLSQWHILHCL